MQGRNDDSKTDTQSFHHRGKTQSFHHRGKTLTDSERDKVRTGSQPAEQPQGFAGQDGSPPEGPAERQGGGAESWRGNIPPKFYRVGEVVEYAGVSRQTIHNYTTMGLLHEADWTRGGHRLFDESVFYRLDKIAELKAEGRPMEQIRLYFENNEMPALAQ